MDLQGCQHEDSAEGRATHAYLIEISVQLTVVFREESKKVFAHYNNCKTVVLSLFATATPVMDDRSSSGACFNAKTSSTVALQC